MFVKGQRGRSKSRGPKKDPKASNNISCYFCKKPEHIKKNCMKYKEMLKTRGGKDYDWASINRKSDQASVVEEADENPCDVLTAESEKKKYLEAWLLDSGCIYHMCPKREWFSTYKYYDEGSILMGNDAMCKTVGIGNIL